MWTLHKSRVLEHYQDPYEHACSHVCLLCTTTGSVNKLMEIKVVTQDTLKGSILTPDAGLGYLTQRTLVKNINSGLHNNGFGSENNTSFFCVILNGHHCSAAVFQLWDRNGADELHRVVLGLSCQSKMWCNTLLGETSLNCISSEQAN